MTPDDENPRTVITEGARLLMSDGRVIRSRMTTTYTDDWREFNGMRINFGKAEMGPIIHYVLRPDGSERICDPMTEWTRPDDENPRGGAAGWMLVFLLAGSATVAIAVLVAAVFGVR